MATNIKKYPDWAIPLMIVVIVIAIGALTFLTIGFLSELIDSIVIR